MKIKPVTSGSPPGVEQAVTMGNLFKISQRKKDFPIMILLLSWKTKPGNYGLAQGGSPVFMMEKTFTIFKNKDGKAFKNGWSIIEDKKGSIWFGEDDGLWRYDGSTFTKVSQRRAYAIIPVYSAQPFLLIS